MQLDRGTLRVETEAGLPLFVGADTVVGNKGADWGYDETELPAKTVIPPLPRPPWQVKRPFVTSMLGLNENQSVAVPTFRHQMMQINAARIELQIRASLKNGMMQGC